MWANLFINFCLEPKLVENQEKNLRELLENEIQNNYLGHI